MNEPKSLYSDGSLGPDPAKASFLVENQMDKSR